ncbi:hypothetical protein [Companilactobacillus nantensis]|uniref:Uncharacterized protein n=1 Tax=Companilactobacillus nantensis DSM 16982 TaxID=1423774 RepID=A0A0R1WDL8_9LACO|nr:hypothetical protein [Companilactobacillus nantensis]KRM15905.1 hypothetical protein FD31_GL000800 [Companilactobacillus nantensis DSM 16982]GEO64765.1 hypothetical protein LNA01_19480 [Companilactobacillus nantensis]
MTENKLTETIIGFNKANKKNIKVIRSNDKTFLPDDDGVVTMNISGGSTSGGGNIPDNPSAGVDYYAGSLANGEITERYLLYSGPSDPTTVTKATLLRDVGSKMNMVGDGLTFFIHLKKTSFDKGTKGDSTDIQLNYDPANIVKDGYFTTTSPYPIYIKAGDFGVGKQVTVPINGIGENLSGKNVKVPKLLLTFNDDKTIEIETIIGYDNDGDSAGATGANYDVVVDTIATFSVQPAVAQIPETVNFFTGSANGEISLSGALDFLENSLDGIEITFDEYFTNSIGSTRIPALNALSTRSVRIPKEKLINGFRFDLTGYFNPIGTKLTYTVKTNTGLWQDGANYFDYLSTPADAYIEISKASINIPIKLGVSNTISGSPINYNSSWIPTISKITPYKN